MPKAKFDSDLLKSAIADAKAIKEISLENAKQELIEAYTPQLKSMLEKKLEEEVEYVDDELEERKKSEKEDEDLEDEKSEDELEDEKSEDETEATEDETEKTDDVVDDILDDEMEDDSIDEELQRLIAELESEEGLEDEEDFDAEKEMTDEPVETNIENDEEISLEPVDEIPAEDTIENDDEEIDLNELYNSLMNETTEEELTITDDETDMGGKSDSVVDDEIIAELNLYKEKLDEAYKVIRFMKDKIGESNLLNAKLLYANKLFKEYALQSESKNKIIESLDRAKNVRETKLIYVTLHESLTNATTKRNPKSSLVTSLTEGISSKLTTTTKPRKEILNENNVVDGMKALYSRFQKLAGTDEITE